MQGGQITSNDRQRRHYCAIAPHMPQPALLRYDRVFNVKLTCYSNSLGPVLQRHVKIEGVAAVVEAESDEGVLACKIHAQGRASDQKRG